MLLWLWCRPEATAPTQSLAWEPPYATGVALKKKRENKTNKQTNADADLNCNVQIYKGIL